MDERTIEDTLLVPGCPRCDIALVTDRVLGLRFYGNVTLLMAAMCAVAVGVVADLDHDVASIMPFAGPIAVLGVCLAMVGVRERRLARARLTQARQMIHERLCKHGGELAAIRHDHLTQGLEPICDGCLAELLGKPSLGNHAHRARHGTIPTERPCKPPFARCRLVEESSARR